MSTVSAPGQARPVTPVGLLADRLEALAVRAECEAPGLAGELTELTRLAGGLESYVDRHTSPAGRNLVDLAAATARHDWTAHAGTGLEQEMLSGHVEGQFLQILTAATGARRVLDVGMFTGYSALAMAQALPDGGRVVACEVDARVAAMASASFRAATHGDRIEIRLGPAGDTLRELAGAGQRFDLVFIDADKAGYADYLSVVLDALLAPGGLIVVDNTLMQGLPWTAPGSTPNAHAIGAFNDAVTADDRVRQVLLPLRDGITLIQRISEGST
ncbi:O-methyltransferase [Branchiibius cervicis]|uniref:O-methyltransferase n=1 Tax=Branchiibius cervicis TaxID=908252 RepID=A0ABW2APL0_9MICO